MESWEAYASMDTKIWKAYAVRSAILHARAYAALRRYPAAWSVYTQAAHLVRIHNYYLKV